jgi:hypothetical protein
MGLLRILLHSHLLVGRGKILFWAVVAQVVPYVRGSGWRSDTSVGYPAKRMEAVATALIFGGLGALGGLVLGPIEERVRAWIWTRWTERTLRS